MASHKTGRWRLGAAARSAAAVWAGAAATAAMGSGGGGGALRESYVSTCRVPYMYSSTVRTVRTTRAHLSKRALILDERAIN